MGTSLPATDLSTTLGRDSRLQGLANRLQALKPEEGGKEERIAERAELRQAAQDFEAMFINLLLREMWPDQEEEGMFGKSTASEFYRDMFNTELSNEMSRSGQLGLAEMLERQVAGMLGLEEEDDGFIPGKVLGRALPQPVRRGAERVYQAVEQVATKAAERFLRPLTEGWISSRFGMRNDPFNGERRHHEGIDFAALEGSPVKASADGVVKFSGRQTGYGNLVIIEHTDGYETRYAHNADNHVRKGEVVSKGQVIASVGDSGRATGPHLHFEVRKEGEAVDPIGFLR
ncbi:MAG TPA: peptidoglycan DD-metalloendopeptidase family protein [Acidobacteriota bacterium]|nr:peptidoglycan DD-metalloendopeptidase family protein [Acidobacteriota bacterium]